MKKVLILTTSTGQGHNQAADSLVESFSNAGFECVKHDFLGSDNKIMNKIIVLGYEISASTFPHIYGVAYKLTDKKYIKNFTSLVFTKSGKKLLKRINEVKPDVIIGTHPFSVNIVCKLKEKGLINIPFISVVTDFKAHYAYVNPLVDSYITASNSTKQYLVTEGINKDIIFPIGIPIKEGFYDRNEHIPNLRNDEYFNLLLMSGSMGLKNISYVVDELLKNKHKLRLTVVCGKNEHLKDSLLKKCNKEYKDKKLHILGFSNDIDSFMEYSDIIISKPGGLTVTESIVKNLPLIIPFVIPGQEMENTDFLTSHGYAYYVKNYKDINSSVDKLIENPEYIKKMKENLAELSSHYSTTEAVNIAEKLINKYNKKEAVLK